MSKPTPKATIWPDRNINETSCYAIFFGLEEVAAKCFLFSLLSTWTSFFLLMPGELFPRFRLVDLLRELFVSDGPVFSLYLNIHAYFSPPWNVFTSLPYRPTAAVCNHKILINTDTPKPVKTLRSCFFANSAASTTRQKVKAYEACWWCFKYS